MNDRDAGRYACITAPDGKALGTPDGRHRARSELLAWIDACPRRVFDISYACSVWGAAFEHAVDAGLVEVVPDGPQHGVVGRLPTLMSPLRITDEGRFYIGVRGGSRGREGRLRRLFSAISSYLQRFRSRLRRIRIVERRVVRVYPVVMISGRPGELPED